MAGLYKSVKAHILKQNPRAFFVPCAAHSLNLCLKDAGGSSSMAQLFFGMNERIYVLFSASINRWKILKKHFNKLSIKKWAETRWNSRVNAVKAIRFQLNEVVEALEEISDTANDLKIKSESHSLAKEIYVSMSLLNGLIIFLENYRENGYALAKVKAEEIISPMGIEIKFKKNKIRKKTKMFHYESIDDSLNNEEENFRVKYFLVLVDQTLASLKNMGEEELFKHSQDLQITLTDGESADIDTTDLCSELIIFRTMVNENTTAIQALRILKTSCGSFPNINIAFRILLTIPVASEGAERAFSKLKIIKNYLRSTISQDRLSGLAILLIENELAETLDYNQLIDQFALQKARKKQLI
ncbi:zinc finger MYM-type protein 1-like [Melanaphis sacchari]|uniref:zinc finger MYM-type protein 1-like n=1 Tax=Melanaphis sacchari TaxID=742174 RepID=UPI000DC1336A|nr:zinc finger MYM-type protein 1-like [Melanaphis sacchari]